MMEIKIQYWKDIPRKRQIESAISIINGLQNHFYLIPKPTDTDVVIKDYADWYEFLNNYSADPAYFDEHIIFITEKPFDDNWFSHEDNRIALITIHDWEEHFSPPSLRAYLVYQIAQTLISFESDLNEKIEMRLVHDEPTGCMFDMCMDKTDIHLSMIGGNICPTCKGILRQFGTKEKSIYSVERLLSYVRSEAIGKPMIFNEDAAFIVMRFSQYDDNDNAFKYGIKAALTQLGISCIRADNAVTSGQLLEKIEKHINNCRFVIVKVDNDNLNVYFELGLAMGLKKDILLISENDLVLNLPTDLKNWECLTYPKGNYEQLKNNIIDFFVKNYHYNPQ